MKHNTVDKSIAILFALILTINLVACKSNSLQRYETRNHSTAAEKSDTQSPVLLPGYMISITVLVAGEPEIQIDRKRIQADGRVELPLLGAVPAGKKTLKEFEIELRNRYNESYFINPQVIVDFVIGEDSDAFPWGYVTVLGKVKKPGRVRIPPTRDLTLTQAIQKVGGLDDYAKEKAVQITRSAPYDSETFTVNLNKIPDSGGEDDLLLRPGDVIYIPEVVF